MKSQRPVIINLLNDALKYELRAINQKFLHARTLKDLRYVLLAPKERTKSIEEVEHADSRRTQLGLTDILGLKNFLKIRNGIIKILKTLNWKAGFFRKDIGWKAIGRNANN